MVPEKVVKRSAVHREIWLERTTVVMVVLGFDFGFGRYAERPVKDANLSSTGAEVEEDVMHVSWPV